MQLLAVEFVERSFHALPGFELAMALPVDVSMGVAENHFARVRHQSL